MFNNINIDFIVTYICVSIILQRLFGEALDDSNGSLERPQDTTRAVLKDSVPKDDIPHGEDGQVNSPIYLVLTQRPKKSGEY